MNNPERIIEYLEKNFDRHLEDIRSYLRIPSVSYTGEGIQETAEAVKGWIERLGGTAELLSFDCGYHPVVYGRIDSGAPRTLLIYGMYDVMPADEPGWIAPPFGGEIHEWKDLGRCIINRGAVNTKGPLYGFFTTLRAIIEVNGRLPFNLIFAIEGEEEYGAISFAQFAKEYAHELREAEAALFPSFGQDASGTAQLELGYKGVMYIELKCRGGQWGGPTVRGIHSSNNVWVANPVWRLVQALSTMSDENEHVTIEGFYDQVKELEPEDKALCRKLANSGHPQQVLGSNDVLEFKWDKSLEEMYYYAYGQPQLNICGIWGGYTGPGTKTLLPHEATVKMDVRMVRDMDPDRVEKMLRNHLDNHGYTDIEMRVLEKYPWSKQDINAPVVQAVIDMYRLNGIEPVIHPTCLGTAPFYVFDRILELPYCGGGMGHGGRAHSDNEYCTVDGLLQFQKSMVQFFDVYSKVK